MSIEIKKNIIGGIVIFAWALSLVFMAKLAEADTNMSTMTNHSGSDRMKMDGGKTGKMSKMKNHSGSDHMKMDGGKTGKMSKKAPSDKQEKVTQEEDELSFLYE